MKTREVAALPRRARPPVFAETKFLAPSQRGPLVRRHALIERLDGADDLPLSIVVGAPGSGKTSVLASWFDTTELANTVWLNADRADDDPVRFWRGFIAAVQRIRPDFGVDAADLLTLDDAVTPDALEALLIDDATLDTRVRVVIDDFQFVSLLAAQQIQHLLERGLLNVRLMLGGRSDPAVGLHRLRVAGELCEIREADLLLGLEETRQLVELLGVDPGSIDVDALQARTEGWAAGVQMATLSILGSSDPAARALELAGTTQTIAGYLTTELLSSQPDDIRRFLLFTCVADELDNSMCEALMEGHRATPAVTLHDVEAAQLLVHRLDPGGSSFRYHQLFGEMLRHQLHAQDPDRFREQHRRAAAEYQRRDDVTAAVRHLWFADRRDEAASLLRFRLLSLVAGTGAPPPVELVGALSDDELLSSPADSIGYAVAYVLNGQPSAAARLLVRAQAALDPASSPVVDRLHVACGRVAAELSIGDTDAAIQCVRDAVTLLSDHGAQQDEWTAAAIPFGMRACAWAGDFELADRLSRSLQGNPDQPLSQIDTLGTLAYVAYERGDLPTAIEHARAAHQLAVELGMEGGGADVAARAALGLALLEQGAFGDAERELSAMSSSPRVERIPMAVLAAGGLSRLLRATGRFDAALHAITAARLRLGEGAAGPAFVERLNLAELRVRLAMADLDGARRLADGLPADHRSDVARAWWKAAAGDLDGLALDIDRLAGQTASVRQQLDVALLRAWLAVHRGDADLTQAVDTVIDLAGPTGSILAIAEAGTAVLQAVIAAAHRRIRTPFIEQLLATQPLPRPIDQARPEYKIDELSARELIVLRYMATSLTNQDIADELFLSVNTVKTHIKHVLRKLGGSSRADAVRRAQELHYL